MDLYFVTYSVVAFVHSEDRLSEMDLCEMSMLAHSFSLLTSEIALWCMATL